MSVSTAQDDDDAAAIRRAASRLIGRKGIQTRQANAATRRQIENLGIHLSLDEDAETQRDRLLAQAGPEPSSGAVALVHTIVQLKVRIVFFDRMFVKRGKGAVHDNKTYMSYVNGYRRALVEFERLYPPRRDPAPIPPSPLASYLATQSHPDAASADPRVTAAPDDATLPGDTEAPP